MISTLTDAIATYRVLAQAEGSSPKTIPWVTESARYLDRFLGEGTPLDQVTAHEVRRWIAALRERPRFGVGEGGQGTGRHVSPTTINTYVRGVRLLLSTLIREELIEDHPVAHFKPPKTPRLVVQPFDEKQLKRIFKAFGAGAHPLRDRVVTALLLDSCLRLSEAVPASLDLVNLDTREMRVLGKGAKERTVPLGAWTVKQLVLYLHKERPETASRALFLEGDGAPLTPHAFQQILRRVTKRVGFRVHAHAFRHTGALWSLRNGADAFHIQRLLGHSSLTTTRRYIAILDSDVKDAHKQFSPGDRFRL